MTSASIAREPVPAETLQPPVSEPVDDEVSTPYVAQRGGRLFYRRECAWASRISRNDRVGLEAAADAEREGFVSCPACDDDRELATGLGERRVNGPSV
jgi:hypothetical protein